MKNTKIPDLESSIVLLVINIVYQIDFKGKYFFCLSVI